MTQENKHSFDVIIAGGALAGASLALSLSKLVKNDNSKLSIAVVETHDMNQQLPKSYDARVIALSHGSACYLKELGVWQSLKPDALPIDNIHISDRTYYGKARLSAKDYNVSALGYVAEMQSIGNSLIMPLLECDNVHFFAPERIDSIAWQRDNVTVVLDSGTELTASVLLGCDGGHSTCRTEAKIESRVSDYQQVAIIANVTAEKPHNGRAFERFTDSGPLALLPMTENRCSLVWTISTNDVATIMALSDDDFAKALEDNFGGWLGKFTTVGKRFSFDLKLVQANEQIHHRMALLGNASHTLHPIAGQGFNLGMRDVQVISDIIHHALKDDKDIGSFAVLNQYAENRLIDHQQTIKLTDSLVHLFSNTHLPLVVGRGIGLKVLNYLPPLKTVLAEKTMGHS